METMTQTGYTQGVTHRQSAMVPTFTLEQLIKAISEEVKPGEDRLVAEVLLHLLDTGRVKPMGSTAESPPSIVLALSDNLSE